MSERVQVFTHEAMVDHRPGEAAGYAHPERPERLAALLQLLDDPALAGAVEVREPTAADAEALASVHAEDYVERLLRYEQQRIIIDADTALSTGSIYAARLAAGALVDAVETVSADAATSRRALALVRPPGHHAEPTRAMGFCLFDNIAIAAESALASGKAERVLIVDWDVHHGNGTQAAFYDRPDVLVFDVHQSPLFPGTGGISETGSGDGAGFTVNCPLPAGCADAEYLAIFDRILSERAAQFDPDLVLVSAGFDAHRADPLGSMELTSQGFGQLCRRVVDIADRHAGGRLVLTLEGGYDLGALTDSVAECVGVLAGGEAAPNPSRHREALDPVFALLAHTHLRSPS